MAETTIPKRYKSLQEWVDTEKQFGYDLQGYINKYGVPDVSGGKHLTDEFKLPHHITFSQDSIYHTPQTPGGVWRQLANGKWSYTPSPYVLSQHPPEELQRYFKEREPDSILRLPDIPTIGPETRTPARQRLDYENTLAIEAPFRYLVDTFLKWNKEQYEAQQAQRTGSVEDKLNYWANIAMNLAPLGMATIASKVGKAADPHSIARTLGLEYTGSADVGAGKRMHNFNIPGFTEKQPATLSIMGTPTAENVKSKLAEMVKAWQGRGETVSPKWLKALE